MADESILEPQKEYKSKYKQLFYDNTVKYFEELTKEAGTDVPANNKTCDDYYAKLEEIKNIDKKLAGKKSLRTFVIVTIILMVVAAVIASLICFSDGSGGAIAIGIISDVVALGYMIGMIILIKKKINPMIKNIKELLDKLKKQAQELLDTAWRQMATLNALYDWSIPARIMNNTTPLLHMDEIFDQEKFLYLNKKYGLTDNDNVDSSTYICQSGSILGNPFLLCKDFDVEIINQRYDGQLTIHWTTTVHTKNGTSTRHHTQTLHAHIYRPKPNYYYNTYLIYGNDAAPKLTFSRRKSGMTGATEKEINKHVKKGAKELNKMAEKAVKKGESYTRFNNDEFEVLFGGTDRNDELEYRLLFTPLAQKNLLTMIKNKEPFGDDFQMVKDHQLNFVRSDHSQWTDYYANPQKFVGFDYRIQKDKFIKFMTQYFEGIFFDLAPLISIPLYQQHKSREFIYEEEFTSNISTYEHEQIANSFDINLFKPETAYTQSILKTNLVRKEGVVDVVDVTAHAYEGYKRVTYVSVRGGDGHYHSVPVYWIEYIPVEKTTTMSVQKKGSSRFEFNTVRGTQEFNSALNSFSSNDKILYERGLFASILNNGDITSQQVEAFNNAYKGNPNAAAVVRGATLATILELLKEEDNVADQSTETNSTILSDENVEAKEAEATDEDKNQEEVKPQEENGEGGSEEAQDNQSQEEEKKESSEESEEKDEEETE